MTREFSLTLDDVTYKVVVDGNSVLVDGRPFVVGFGEGRVLVDDDPYDIILEDDAVILDGIAHPIVVEGLEDKVAGPKEATVVAGEGAVTAIMPGKIIRILVDEGDEVAKGDVVCILEAMKMENELKAPMGGIVKTLHVQAGQDVETGTVLAEIE